MSREKLQKAENRSKRTWLQREIYTLPDGKELEVVATPDESIVVPITRDGKILLIQRRAPAFGGRPITTVLSAANAGQEMSKEVAARALNKLSLISELRPTGAHNPWKYLTSTSYSFRTDVDFSSALEGISVNDPIINNVFLSPEDFYSQIDSGEITDLRAIIAVQFALASIPPSDTTPWRGDPEILRLLTQLQIQEKRVITEAPEEDWFPRKEFNGDETIHNSSNQAQVIGVKTREGTQSIVFLVEPFYAQGKSSLSLPSGSIEEGETGENTAEKEMLEEAGYVLQKNAIIQLTPTRYPLPLYLTVGSSVYEAPIIGKDSKDGDESLSEQGKSVEIPVAEIGGYIRNGYINDASVIAALLDWGRKHNVPML